MTKVTAKKYGTELSTEDAGKARIKEQWLDHEARALNAMMRYDHHSMTPIQVCEHYIQEREEASKAYEKSKSHLDGEKAEYVRRFGYETFESPLLRDKILMDGALLAPAYNREPFACKIARLGEAVRHIVDELGEEELVGPAAFEVAIRRCR